jgi:hypothetical protein
LGFEKVKNEKERSASRDMCGLLSIARVGLLKGRLSLLTSEMKLEVTFVNFREVDVIQGAMNKLGI